MAIQRIKTRIRFVARKCRIERGQEIMYVLAKSIWLDTEDPEECEPIRRGFASMAHQSGVEVYMETERVTHEMEML